GGGGGGGRAAVAHGAHPATFWPPRRAVRDPLHYEGGGALPRPLCGLPRRRRPRRWPGRRGTSPAARRRDRAAHRRPHGGRPLLVALARHPRLGDAPLRRPTPRKRPLGSAPLPPRP